MWDTTYDVQKRVMMFIFKNKNDSVFLEESAYKVLTNEAPGGGHIAGVPKIMKAYELHKDNAEVVESVVTLLMELAEYGQYWYILI